MAARKRAAKPKAPRKPRKAGETAKPKAKAKAKPPKSQEPATESQQPPISPPPRPQAPTPGEKTDLLNAIGIDTICGMIRSGMSQAEIAHSFSCSAALLSDWLSKPERLARAREARLASAEAWMDRGMRNLEAAQTGVEVQRAREIAQHCRKMAAIRNPQYSDRVAIDAEVGPRQFTDEQLIAQLRSKLHAAGMDEGTIAGVIARYESAKRPEGVL